jgi:hypothetical protein
MFLTAETQKASFIRPFTFPNPNEEDRNQEAERGVWPGGDIMLQGLPNGFGWLGEVHPRTTRRTAVSL